MVLQSGTVSDGEYDRPDTQLRSSAIAQCFLGGNVTTKSYEIGPFRLSAEQLLLTRDNRPIALGPKVVETLLALAERPGEIVSKHALLDRIWPEGFVEEANLSQNIYLLRKVFAQHGAADPVETVPRRGYRLRLQLAPPRRTAPGRTAVVAAGAAFLMLSLLLVSGYGAGGRGAPSQRLSADGARLYQLGRYYWNTRTREGVARSLALFTRVVDADPSDARGYAALADANVTIGDYCYGTHLPAVYFARADAYAKRALTLDPNSAEAHAALGSLALHRAELKFATAELLRAQSLAPTYAPAQEWYGVALLQSGKTKEAIARLKQAAALDPLSVATLAWLAKAALLERRFDDAVVYSRLALELSPKRVDSLVTLGQAYQAKGDARRAVDAFKRFGAVGPYYRADAVLLLQGVKAGSVVRTPVPHDNLPVNYT